MTNRINVVLTFPGERLFSKRENNVDNEEANDSRNLSKSDFAATAAMN